MSKHIEEKSNQRLVGEFVQQIAEGHIRPARNAYSAIKSAIDRIDQLLTDQVNEILHHPAFRRLEATWRGLFYLVDRSETGPLLEIHVLNVSKRDLLDDFRSAVEFNETALFKKIYEEVYEAPGGVPYGALVGDYEFAHGPQDVALLEGLANVAAAAQAPFISGASPAIFGLASFRDLANPRDLAEIFDAADYAGWRSFRDSEHARYIGLTMPHILLRRPLGSSACPGFSFSEETSEGREGDGGYLWGNAAFAFAACLTNAFAKYAWCAAIRGLEGGGRVEDLPFCTVANDEGDVTRKCPTEIAVTDRREKELADLGFIPLLHHHRSDYAVFFSAPSCQRPHKYGSDDATANARVAGQLQCVLTTSRFAHYIKVLARDRIGSFLSRGDYESFLNRWLSNYVLFEDGATLLAKAKRPLREARVDLVEIPGKPGAYKAVVFLRPHFQLEELSVSLRMVVDLPAPHL